MKSDINLYESTIAQLIKTSYSEYDDVLDDNSVNNIIQHVFRYNPIIYYYVGDINLEGEQIGDIPHILIDKLKSELNKVIPRKILWSLGFTICATILLIKTVDKSDSKPRRRMNESRYNSDRVYTRRKRSIARR